MNKFLKGSKMVNLKSSRSGIFALFTACGFTFVNADPVLNTFTEISVGDGLYKDIVLNINVNSTWPYTPIALDGCVSPEIADLDQDGVKDLLTGVIDGGTVIFMKNNGTDLAPQYADPVFLRIDAVDTPLIGFGSG